MSQPFSCPRRRGGKTHRRKGPPMIHLERADEEGLRIADADVRLQRPTGLQVGEEDRSMRSEAERQDHATKVARSSMGQSPMSRRGSRGAPNPGRVLALRAHLRELGSFGCPSSPPAASGRAQVLRGV